MGRREEWNEQGIGRGTGREKERRGRGREGMRKREVERGEVKEGGTEVVPLIFQKAVAPLYLPIILKQCTFWTTLYVSVSGVQIIRSQQRRGRSYVPRV